MTLIQRQVAKLDPWVERIVTCPYPYLHLNYTRQGGKSTGMVLRAADWGVKQRRKQILISASQRQSSDLAAKAIELLHPFNIIRNPDDQSSIEIRDGHLWMVFLPPNPNTIRGPTGDVYLDEWAMVRDQAGVFGAVTPMLTRLRNGRLTMSSTPKGEGDHFAETRFNEEFCRIECSIEDAIRMGGRNAKHLRRVARKMKRLIDDEEIYDQEFGCKYIDEAHAFLTYNMIRSCHNESLLLENEGFYDLVGGDLVCGVDLGRERDRTVFWVAEEFTPGFWRTVCVVVMHRVEFAEQYRELRLILEHPRIRKVAIDATWETALAEQAVKDYGEGYVEPVKFTQVTKNTIAGCLKRFLRERRLEIPVDDAIMKDLHAPKRLVGTGGGLVIDAVRNQYGHADRFWAAGLAAYAAGNFAAGEPEFGNLYDDEHYDEDHGWFDAA